jgi:putative peptidoglycan lipid II flippase
VRARILRASALVLASAVTVRALGLVKNVLAAAFFGTSGEMDAYLVAVLLPEMAVQIAHTGVFNFIPIFAAERERSEEDAWRAAGRVLGYWMLLLALALSVVLVLSPSLTGLIAPGLTGARHAQTVGLTRQLLVMGAAVGLARLFTVVLHADRRFAAAAFSEAAFQVVSIAYLVAFRKVGIEALAVAQICGGFAQLAVVATGLLRQRSRIHPRLDLESAPVRRTIGLTLPVYLGALGERLNLAVSRGFASLLAPGAVSALQYAHSIAEAIPSIVSGALTTSLFPFLSREFAGVDESGARTRLRRAMVAVAVVFMPLSAGIWLLARVLIWTLFEHGHFNASSTDVTVAALQLFAPGTFALALNAFIGSVFHARNDTLTPTKAGFVRVGANLALCSMLVPVLGYRGVALATTLALYAKLLVLVAFVRRVIGSDDLRAAVSAWLRILLAVGVMLAVMYPLLARARQAHLPLWVAGLALLVLAGLGALAYALGLWLFCRTELRELFERTDSPRPRSAVQPVPEGAR